MLVFTSVTVTSPLERFWSISGGTRTVTQPTWKDREVQGRKPGNIPYLLLHHGCVDLAHIAVLVLNTNISEVNGLTFVYDG